MFDRGLHFYAQQREETKQIINKINAKQYLEMFKSRSEGFEIVNDFKQDLKRSVQKSKTQKINVEEGLIIRGKLLTMQPKTKKEELEFQNNQKIQEKNREFIKHQKEMQNNADVRAKRRRRTKGKTNHELLQTEEKLMQHQGKNELMMIQQQADGNGHELNNEKINQQQSCSYQNDEPYRQNKVFLPKLQMMIKDNRMRMNHHHFKIKNIIIQMIILALTRRKNGKLMDALDILLQAELYFPADTVQFKLLKSIWLELIGKVYIQMNNSVKQETNKNKWKKTTRKSSIKATAQARRQKTVIIRSIASRRAFFNRFSNGLRKLSLIYESTFLRQCKNIQNKMDNSSRRLVSRLNQQYIISYPHPSTIFLQVPDLQDYGIVIISIDKQNHLFPYNFPRTLDGLISRDDYKQKLCKINSRLIPQTRCFNYESALHFSFEYILLLLFIVFFTSLIFISAITEMQGPIKWFVIILPLFLISIVCYQLQNSQRSNSGKSNEIYQSLLKILSEWQQQYSGIMLKLSISDKVDLIIMSFITYQEQVSSYQSSVDVQRQSNSKKVSICLRLPIQNQHMIDQIDQLSVYSDRNQEKEEDFIYNFGSHQEQEKIEELSSKDQVLLEKRSVESDSPFEFIGPENQVEEEEEEGEEQQEEQEEEREGEILDERQ